MTEHAAAMSLAFRALRRVSSLPSARASLLRRMVLWSAGWMLGCAAGTGAYAQIPVLPASAPTADEAKAAHLHRFAGFVEWPAASFASPESPIVVGIAGAAAVEKELAHIVAGRLVQNRGMQVIELSEPRQGMNLHILMIGRGAWKRASEWLAAVKGQPVLVVTDLSRGLERGAALGFIETDGRLRFEASVPAAEAAGLRLSSRLLALAERVVKAP